MNPACCFKVEIIKLPNPVDPSKPEIVFRYSEQRHIRLEPTKENRNKRDYLRSAITIGTTPLRDEPEFAVILCVH